MGFVSRYYRKKVSGRFSTMCEASKQLYVLLQHTLGSPSTIDPKSQLGCSFPAFTPSEIYVLDAKKISLVIAPKTVE